MPLHQEESSPCCQFLPFSFVLYALYHYDLLLYLLLHKTETAFTYPILSVLPEKFARFLFEFHSGRFESLDLPLLPDDRSQFDVHGALKDDKVKQFECLR